MQQEEWDGGGREMQLNGTGSFVSGCSGTTWDLKAVACWWPSLDASDVEDEG